MLSLIDEVVKRTASEKLPDVSKLKSGSMGQLSNTLAAAWRYSVGRTVNHWLMGLGILGRAFGTDYHITEAVRCFDALEPRMVKVTEKVGSKTHTWWEFQTDLEAVKGKVPYDPDGNDKEWAYSFKALQDALYKMWLADKDKYAGRIKRGMEIIDAADMYWYLRSGKDPAFRFGARDRVMHPAASSAIRFQQRMEMMDDPALKKELLRLRNEAVMQLESEMQFYDNGKYGECLTWPTNVLALTPKNKRGSVANEDGYQPSVYVTGCIAHFMELGLFGLGMFATERFQKAMANTVYALMGDAPYKLTATNGKVYESFCYHNNAPVSERIFDGTKTKSSKRTFKVPWTKPRYPGEALERVLVSKPVFSDGDYTEPKGQLASTASGLGLWLGTEDYLDFCRREFLGGNKLEANGTHISYLVGYALRLAAEQGMLKWQ